MLYSDWFLDIIKGVVKPVLPPVVSDWKKVYYGMSLHIDGACPKYFDHRSGSWVVPQGYYGPEYQDLFDRSLLNRHEREKEATRNFRLSQYRPFTKDPFQRVIHVITGAIFQDTGYSIVVDAQEDNEYIWGNNFDGDTIIGYIAKRSKNIFEDANGFFLVVPAEPYYNTTSGRISPMILFVHSKNIVHITSDELVFKHYDQFKNETIWAVNKQSYFRYRKGEDGHYEHIDAEYGGYYAHMLGKLPIVQAGGIENSQGYFDSFLDAGKAFADEFISNKSAEQLVNKDVSHPYMQVASEECPDCIKGTVEMCSQCEKISEACDCSDPNPQYYSLRHCGSCAGTGQKVRNPGDWLVAPAESMDKDLIKIHSPDISINKFHAENNEKIYDCIIKALHMHWIEQSQSGIAKDRDMETRYQFITSICNDWFDRLIHQLIELILSLRNAKTVNGVTTPYAGSFTITKPTQFAIKTGMELLNEFKTASDSKAPLFVLTKQMEDYLDKMYGGDMLLKKKWKFISTFDKWAVASMDYIQNSLLNGGGDSRQLQFHEELPLILESVVMEKGKDWFMSASIDEIKSIVDAKFSIIAPLNPMLIVPPKEEMTDDNTTAN